MFGAIRNAFKAGSKEIKAEYGENRDFLEAVCAASALVAAADGDIEDSERRKIVSTIQNHPALGKLYQSNLIEQTAETMLKRAKDASGRQLLARELDDIKSRPNGSQMAEDVYLVALDVANSDGEIEPQEDAVLKKIASRLGVDLSKFDF